MGNHSVSAAPLVLCGSEWVIAWCWLWEPNVTTVTVELAALERLGNVLLDDDGASGSVNEPCTYRLLADTKHDEAW